MKSLVFVVGKMSFGGAERVVANLANKYVENGIDTSIVAIYGDEVTYDLDQRIHYVPIICKAVPKLKPLERAIALRKYIRKKQPDIVISFLENVNMTTIISLLGTKQPVVVSVRTDPTRSPVGKKNQWLRDKLYRYVNGMVLQTPDVEKYFANRVSDKAKRIVIPNPIKENLPVYEGRYESKEFVTACRLVEQKNLPLLLDAFSKVVKVEPACTLKVYGEGPLKSQLLASIKEKGLSGSVELCGFTSLIHEKMAKAAAFVISSDFEGISNSMLEALAIGTPVISTDCPVGGARMFVKSYENGILVPVNDSNALAEAMLYIVQNPEKAREFGNAATDIKDELHIDRENTSRRKG